MLCSIWWLCGSCVVGRDTYVQPGVMVKCAFAIHLHRLLISSLTCAHQPDERRLAKNGGEISLTIRFKFCCDCGPEAPVGGGPCCGAMALCGGRPAHGGPFPTLIARAGPPPFGGPDMAALCLLFYVCALQLRAVSCRTGKGRVALRVKLECGLGWRGSKVKGIDKLSSRRV